MWTPQEYDKADAAAAKFGEAVRARLVEESRETQEFFFFFAQLWYDTLMTSGHKKLGRIVAGMAREQHRKKEDR